MTRILLSIFLFFAAAGPGFGQFSFRFNRTETSWTLSNCCTAVRLRLTPEGQFRAERIWDPRGGPEWNSGPAATPMRLLVGDRWFDSSARFNLVRHFPRPIPGRGFRQTIVLEDLQSTAQFTVELEMYENHPVLRYRTHVTSLLERPVTVREADLLPWSFGDRGQIWRAFRVNQWSNGGRDGNFEPLTTLLFPGGNAATMLTGAHGQQCAWVALRDPNDAGLFAGWEFDGRTAAAVRRREGALEFTALIKNLHRPLSRGEQFSTPWAFVGLFSGDWDEAGYRTQRFVEAVLAKPMPDPDFPYVMWDSWRYGPDVDEHVLRRSAEIAAKLGIEVFTVDLGWSRQIGDWTHDPRKFPGGLRALSDYVHSLGMKFGLHFALAEAASRSPVLMTNPDWTSSNSYGYFDAESLCLSHRPVRDWVIAQAIRLIDEYNVDWIVQDGENMVKECTKTTHTHHPADSNFSNAVDGLNAVLAAVQAARPGTLWENCEDGGNMMTFNVPRNYVTSIAADDSGPLITRQATYGITYPFPPRYSNRYMPDHELGTYITRSYMFGGPWTFMNLLERMRPQDLELAASEIAIYKSIRDRIRRGKVIRLTPPPGETRVDALQSYDEATDSSIIFVVRPQVPFNIRIRPRNLNAEKLYEIRFQDDHQVLVLTGRQIMQSGFVPNLPGMWSAEIVYITPLAPAQ